MGCHPGGSPRRAASRRQPAGAHLQPRPWRPPRNRSGPADPTGRAGARGERPMKADRRRLGVLLMTYGSPADLDDMERYLTAVRGGRPPTPEVIAEFRRRYEAIGGAPPVPPTPPPPPAAPAPLL